MIRFGKRGKLLLRYIGPFEILDKVGIVAYRLALPSSLSGVHKVFHAPKIHSKFDSCSGLRRAYY